MIRLRRIRVLTCALGLEVELQPGRDGAQLAQRARLELADTLARDAEVVTDLFQGLRRAAVEAEAPQDDVLHPGVEAVNRAGELERASLVGVGAVGRLRLQGLGQCGAQ